MVFHLLTSSGSRCVRSAFIALALVASTAYGQFSYSETFSGSTAAGWEYYQGNSGPAPRLTSGATPNAADPEFGNSVIDAAGSGWLRLATTTGDQSNAAYFATPVSSANNDITVRFNVALWGDKGEASGGDGLTFFMRDASQAFDVGAFGGSIGYAQKTGIDGLAGGYFGVALDVYGNYSNPTEGRSGGVGQRENAVVLRGPGDGQTGYNYLAGTGGYDYTETGSATSRQSGDPAIAALARSLDFSSATARPNQATLYRTVEINLSANNQLTVRMQFGEDGGAWTDLFTASLNSFTRPSDLAFGFSSGTGGANQVYEVSNLTVQATAASNTYTWDAGDGDDYWRSSSPDNWSSNQNPPSNAVVVFANVSGTSAPPVILRGGDKIVDSARFTGSDRYTLSSYSNENNKLIFDAAGTGNTSFLRVEDSGSSTGGQTINVDVQLNNKLIVQNDDDQRTLTFGGTINTQGNDLTITGPGRTSIKNLSGGGIVEKEGSGTLVFAGTIATTELHLSGGTLLLDNATVTGTTLRVTANSILDFGTGAGSTLNFTNVIVDAGVTLTVANWTNAVDFFYSQNSPTAATLSRIAFNGYAANATKWVSFDKQITPVPEPGTYGAIFIGASIGLLGFLRLRRRKQS